MYCFAQPSESKEKRWTLRGGKDLRRTAKAKNCADTLWQSYDGQRSGIEWQRNCNGEAQRRRGKHWQSKALQNYAAEMHSHDPLRNGKAQNSDAAARIASLGTARETQSRAEKSSGTGVHCTSAKTKKEELNMPEYKAGEYIIYQTGDRFEIGKIKRVTKDGAFVYYSEGDTAAKTPFDCMHKIQNAYTIRKTALGGDTPAFPLQPGDDVWFANRDELTGEVYTERDRVTGVGFEGFCCPDTTDRPDSMGSPTAWSELGTFAFRTEPEALEAARRMKT